MPKDKTAVDSNENAFAELLGRPRKTGTYHLAYDQDSSSEWRKLLQRQTLLTQSTKRLEGSALAQASDELEGVNEQVDALRAEFGIISFYFAQISPLEYDKLKDRHPATKAQKDEHKRAGHPGVLTLDVEAFAGSLADACITKVIVPSGAEMDGMNPAQWKALQGANYSQAELDQLFERIVGVNASVASVEDVGKG